MKKIPLLITGLLLLLGIGVTNAQINVLHNLSYDSYAYGNLLKVGNVLYGMTEEGGSAGYGNIFSINTDGTNYKELWDFQDTTNYRFNSDGYDPYGSLIMVGNTLFGETTYGGYNGDGNVFSIHTDGTHYRDLWDFDDTGTVSKNYSGYDPEGTLVAIGSRLYGYTDEGGKNGDGTIFRIDTSYSLDSTKARKGFKCLWGSFNYVGDSNGAYPYLGALQVSADNKKLYGVTEEGGIHNTGVVYSIDTSGKHYKDLHDFQDNNSDGGYPYSSVTLNGGMLYGMAEEGGYWGYGTIYSLDTNGTNYNNLYGFTRYSNDGGYPEGDVTIAGNTMYGMTDDYGVNGYGTIFSIATNGSNFQVLGSFDEYNTGGYPEGDLTLSGGMVYGMTEEYGPLNGGTVFSMDLCGSVKVNTSSTWDGGSSNGTATAWPSGGAAPYTYMWIPSGQTTATATGLMAGTYTVTVTSANGCQTMSTVTVASATGVSNIAANAGINVYPNPNNGSFTIALSGTTDKSTVEVVNMMGQTVYTGALTLGSNIINMNTKANGVYLYRIISDNGNLVGQGKLEIQK